MKWPMVPLERIAEVAGGSTPKRNHSEYWDGNIPWVTPTDLPMPGAGIADIYDTAYHITERGLHSCAAKILPVGTVLYSSRATIGKIGIARVPLATNQGFANFTPKPGIDSKYLAYALLYFTPEISSLAGSTTFKEVRRSALKKYKVPLLPLSEQRRIVEILDQADALRKKRAEADAKAARILPALFYKMFGDPVTNPRKLPVETLCKVTSVIHRYPTFYGVDYVSSGVPVVRISDIKDNHIVNERVEDYVKVPKEFSDRFPLTVLEPYDIVMAVRGDTTGKIGLVPPELSGANISANLIRISPDRQRITSLYLFCYLLVCSNVFGRFITDTAKKSITAKNLKTIPVLIPGLDEQKSFEDMVNSILAIERDRAHVVRSLNSLHEILLHRAFTGDLTAQWREAHMKELLEEMEQQVRALGA